MKYLIALTLYFIGGVIFYRFRTTDAEACATWFASMREAVGEEAMERIGPLKIWKDCYKILSILWPIGTMMGFINTVIRLRREVE